MKKTILIIGAFFVFMLWPQASFAMSELVPEVTSSTHPSSDGWYSASSASLSWSRPQDAYGFSFELDQKPDTIPDDVLDTTITTKKTYDDLSEGVWYFHIKARKEERGSFGDTVHFKIQIDSSVPTALKLKVEEPQKGFFSAPLLVFSASDEFSGIGQFRLKIDAAEPVDASSPYSLKDLAAGRRILTLTAYDKAGNSSSASLSYDMPKQANRLVNLLHRSVEFPLYMLLTFAGLILLVLIAALVAIHRPSSRKTKANFQEKLNQALSAEEDLAITIPVIAKKTRKATKPRSSPMKTKRI